ncbi:MAG: DUF1801 domain-containing protein [Myxococcus sp.]|nr:DUF1801 domain-containing protein [Myxococcus sp.]
MKQQKTGKLPPAPGNEVDAFLEVLEHPLRDDVVRVRALLLSAMPGISEAIKWNAPSFRTEEFFATFHLRSTEDVQLVFHTGAKKKATKAKVVLSPKADALVKWLDSDRALVTLSPSRLASQKIAFSTLVREWVTQM